MSKLGANVRSIAERRHWSFRPDQKNWTDAEQAELDRLREAFSAEHLKIECSHTDEGDPWCIVYDRRRSAVLLHIARIDRHYVVVWPDQGRPATQALSIAKAVSLAIDIGRRAQA